MAKTDKRPSEGRPARLPGQIDRAMRAAEDKKALNLVVLDTRQRVHDLGIYKPILSGRKKVEVIR